MAKRNRTKFEAVEPKAAEPGWYVRVTLPHGEQILLSRFETEVRAKDWIATSAAAWLTKYRGGRYRTAAAIFVARNGGGPCGKAGENEVSISPEQVKAARLLHKWTQGQLADKADVSATTIARFETGEQRPLAPIVSTIRGLLEAAGIEFTNGHPRRADEGQERRDTSDLGHSARERKAVSATAGPRWGIAIAPLFLVGACAGVLAFMLWRR